jgi:serine/threonine protein kinase
MALQHQFYLNAMDYEILAQANICSKQYKIVEYFEYQGHTLLEEIEKRAGSHRVFSNKEIMSILCSVVLAMSYVSKLEMTHTTLNPTDIVIDEEGICKVVSGAISQYQLDFTPKKGFYYAPETLKIFKMQSVTNALTNKSAVFTLGVTVLSMVHLSSMAHLYNYQAHTINHEELKTLIESVGD